MRKDRKIAAMVLLIMWIAGMSIKAQEPPANININVTISGSEGGAGAGVRYEEYRETNVQYGVQPAPAQPAPVITCPTLTSSQFSRLISTLKNQSFEDTRKKMAISEIKNNYITSAQLKEILQTFNFEDSRVDVAKEAYDYVCDRQNFFQIYDVFQFEDSKEEVMEYVNSRR